MDNTRVDYSELVVAIQEGDQSRADELLQELIPRLKDYLRVVMKADAATAEECVHEAFVEVLEQINRDNIRNEKYIFSYLLKSCRHAYLHHTKRQYKFDSTDDDHSPDYLVEPAQQYEQLLDQERQRILKKCLEELEAKARKFISYFIDKPEASTQQASRHFGLTGANVRTKKSRIIGRLQLCVKRKSNA